MNKIKKIIKLKNARIYNTHHQRQYNVKKALIIEFVDNERHFFDLDAMTDITFCDYLNPIIDNNTKQTSIFNDDFYN